MVTRINADQQIVNQGNISSVPTLTFASSAADSLRMMGEMTRKVTLVTNQRLDDNARIEGARRGLVDGYGGTLDNQQLYAPTIYGASYTDSALSAYQNRVDLDARTKIAELSAAHPNDPEGLSTALEAYKLGAASEMPPELRGVFEAQYGIYAQSAITKANSNFLSVAQAQAEADAYLLNQRIQLDLQESATLLTSSDPAVREAAMTSIAAMQGQLSATYSSTIQDAFGNEVPAFDPLTQAKALEQFRTDVAYYGSLGWYTDMVAAEQGVAALAALENGMGPSITVSDPDTGEDVPIYLADMLTPADQQKLFTEMRQIEAARRSAITFSQSQFDRNQERVNDGALRQFMLADDFLVGQALLEAAKLNPAIDAATIDKMRGRLESWNAGYTDPTYLAFFETTLELGLDNPDTGMPWRSEDIFGLLDDERFSREDVAELAKLFEQTQDANHYRNFAVFQEGMTNLMAAAGLPDPSTNAWMASDDQSQERFREARLNVLDKIVDLEEAGERVTRTAVSQIIREEVDRIRDSLAARTPLSDMVSAQMAEQMPADALISYMKGGDYTNQEIVNFVAQNSALFGNKAEQILLDLGNE